MPVPTSYTEEELAQYMHAALGKVAEALGLTAPDSYEEAINDALLAYGQTDIAQISGTAGVRKLRALARVAAWRFVIANFAALYDFSADNASYSRSQLLANAEKALKVAEDAAVAYSDAYAGKIVKVRHVNDPYVVQSEEENAL
jgi:hypothetical protein